MQSTTTHISPQSSILPKNWEKSVEHTYTANDLISAYLDGKEAGKKEELTKVKQEFSLNVKLASSIAEELYAIGTEHNLELKSIHLKANTLNSFEALFLVDKNAILSDNFRYAYVIGRNLANKYKTSAFNLSFSFASDSDEINLDCLASDGFFIKYEKR